MKILRKEKKVDYNEVLKEKYKAKAEDKMKFTKENVLNLTDKWIENKTVSFQELQNQIKELDDTPEKVVVPNFVAEFYEECENATLEFLITQLEATYSRSELGKWYSSCSGRHRNGMANAQEVIAKMKLYGYEVEKEPLYHVMNKHECFLLRRYGNEVDAMRISHTMKKEEHGHKDDFKLTESEIKDYDERFWPFAVLVND